VTSAPDYAEPVVGWRAWLVVCEGDELRLHSVARDTVWEPGRRLEADCLRGRALLARWRGEEPHPAPHPACSCGIYALRRPDEAPDALDPHADLGRRVVQRVFGQVRLWGAVVESDRGWRARYAYPSRLLVPSHDLDGRPAPAGDVIGGLRVYRVPVELLDGGREHALRRALLRRREGRPPLVAAG
jgi:hypothetical protein